MHHATTWKIHIFLDQDERQTSARAELTTSDRKLAGHGVARRRPADLDIPEVGSELATARALADVSHQLLEAAAGDIEAVTHKRTQLTS